jgi:hypothetical protein
LFAKCRVLILAQDLDGDHGVNPLLELAAIAWRGRSSPGS